jgi:uncharacterized protein
MTSTAPGLPATAPRPGDWAIRSFEPLLEVRSAAKGGDGRTIEGIAVPYFRRQRIDDMLVEQFARGAFDHQIDRPGRVFFTRGHQSQGGVIIGKAIELRDDALGLWGAWRVSATRDGEDTLALVGDGVLTELSVGFRAGRDHIEPDGTVTRISADLREVSVVPAGAYGEAATILAVRSTEQQDGATTYRPPARRIDQAAAFEWPALPVLPD